MPIIACLGNINGKLQLASSHGFMMSNWVADGWTGLNLSRSYPHATAPAQVTWLMGGTVCWSALPSCTFQLFLPAIRKAPWPPLRDIAWCIGACSTCAWCEPVPQPFLLGPCDVSISGWCLVAALSPPCSHVSLDMPELMPHLHSQCVLRVWSDLFCSAFFSVLVHRGRSYHLQPHNFAVNISISSIPVNWNLVRVSMLCQDFLSICLHLTVKSWSYCACLQLNTVSEFICITSKIPTFHFWGANIICMILTWCLFMSNYE